MTEHQYEHIKYCFVVIMLMNFVSTVFLLIILKALFNKLDIVISYF